MSQDRKHALHGGKQVAQQGRWSPFPFPSARNWLLDPGQVLSEDLVDLVATERPALWSSSKTSDRAAPLAKKSLFSKTPWTQAQSRSLAILLRSIAGRCATAALASARRSPRAHLVFGLEVIIDVAQRTSARARCRKARWRRTRSGTPSPLPHSPAAIVFDMCPSHVCSLVSQPTQHDEDRQTCQAPACLWPAAVLDLECRYG